MRVTVYYSAGERELFHLGAHAPDLDPDDMELVHRLWLDCVKGSMRHRDIVAVALRELGARLAGPQRESVLAQLRSVADGQRRRSA